MRHPYQCIAAFERNPSHEQEGDNASTSFLFAASGPQIITLKLDTGKTVSVWPKDSSISSQNGSDEPPGKKRKVSQTVESGPNVAILVPSNDHRHLIAVTAEDKSIRVLQVNAQGNLTQLSERCMPKRPCAVALTNDGNTILCGDKFGDVYAIPLIYNESTTPEPPPVEKESEKKVFVPSATEKTVHSGRNRKALEDQRRSALKAKPKEALRFTHELLLGHVSLLTDLLFTSVHDSQSESFRSYIITSDRDEHIRVSRGPPQTHIIENFCLGHEEFVSKLALLTPDVLVSGGGDDYLLLWDWKRGTTLERLDLRGPVSRSFQDTTSVEESVEIAISGLWTSFDNTNNTHIVLVALEGVPLLITYVVQVRDGQISVVRTEQTELPGNPLDLAVSEKTIIVSVDTQETDGTSNIMSRLIAFTLVSNYDGSEPVDTPFWGRDLTRTTALQGANGFASIDVDRSKLDELLYTVRNLRKRGGISEE